MSPGHWFLVRASPPLCHDSDNFPIQLPLSIDASIGVEYFVCLREVILFPFILINRLGQFDVEGRVTSGSGETAIPSAIRVAIGWALCPFISAQEKEKLRLGKSPLTFLL